MDLSLAWMKSLKMYPDSQTSLVSTRQFGMAAFGGKMFNSIISDDWTQLDMLDGLAASKWIARIGWQQLAHSRQKECHCSHSQTKISFKA